MNPNPMPAPPQQPQSQGKSSVTIVLILVGALFACCIIGILAAIAIPNFMKFQGRSKMSECKTHLKAIYTGQKSFFAEKDDYADTFKDTGFVPSTNTRYTYFMGEEAVLPPSAAGARAATEADLPEIAGGQLPGVYGECPDDCEFIAACAGNIDSDPELDVWSIGSKEREKNGQRILPGEVFHDSDDLGL